jgi:hypothetical protein
LYDLNWIKNKLSEYGIDSSKVIDKTPKIVWADRGEEINSWLNDHPEVTQFVIIDDNHIGGGISDAHIVKTSWDIGLTLEDASEAIDKLGGNAKP